MKENIEKIELLPDENGFLFEIVDDNYLFSNISGIVTLIVLFFVLLSMNNYDLINLSNKSYMGHIIVYIFLPYLGFKTIRILLYIKKKNFKTVKFYEDYILNSKGQEILLKEIIDGYCIRLSASNDEVQRGSWLLFILAFPLVIIAYSMLIFNRLLFSLYKGNKSIWFDSLVLIRYDNVAVGIPLQIIDNDDKEKFQWYLNKYLKKNIEDFEKVYIKVPEFRAWNLIKDEENKEKFLKEKFNNKD